MTGWMFPPFFASLILLINGCSSIPEAPDQSKPPLPIVQGGQLLSAKVIGVIDGATIKILTSSNNSNIEFRVTLAEIEAPEKYQAFGDKAKQALADKTTGREITLRVVRQDRYGDVFAFIFIGERWINLEMVAEGYAWRGQYSRITELAQAEKEARQGRIGLWADEHPMPPWEYRSQRLNPPEEHNRNEGRNIQPLFTIQW